MLIHNKTSMFEGDEKEEATEAEAEVVTEEGAEEETKKILPE